MKKLLPLMLGCVLFASANARDTTHQLSFAALIEAGKAKGVLDGSVRFYLKGQATPKVSKRLDEGVSNRKTNGVGKADEVACQWAALSALKAFQQSAKQRGANAVLDMVSYYKRNTVESASEYECHAGTFVVGVTFKGTYAVVAK